MSADPKSETTPALILTDPREVLALLRAGDRLTRYGQARWVLAQAGVEVSDEAACILRGGGYVLEPFGGRLAPLGDGLLPGGAMSQTYAWAEERSHGRH